MSIQKLMLPILAAIVGIAASAFTMPSQNGKPYDTADYWYKFDGDQTQSDRMDNTKYINPQTSSFSCGGQEDECAVKITVTLDGLGTPPVHPDFSQVSFNPDGTPKVNGPVKANDLKP